MCALIASATSLHALPPPSRYSPAFPRPSSINAPCQKYRAAVHAGLIHSHAAGRHRTATLILFLSTSHAFRSDARPALCEYPCSTCASGTYTHVHPAHCPRSPRSVSSQYKKKSSANSPISLSIALRYTAAHPLGNKTSSGFHTHAAASPCPRCFELPSRPINIPAESSWPVPESTIRGAAMPTSACRSISSHRHLQPSLVRHGVVVQCRHSNPPAPAGTPD